LQTLGWVTKQVLAFHREHSEAGTFDLVDIADSALKLHAQKLHKHGVKIDRQFRGPASTRVFGHEILQVLSNLILNAVDACRRKSGKSQYGLEQQGSRFTSWFPITGKRYLTSLRPICSNHI
jgi:signal transduction histidine kinase